MEHCKLCGSPYVEIHHCLHGTANRKKADKYNLVIPLCHEHHTGGKQSLQRCQMQKKQSKNLQGIHTTMAKEKAHKISSDSGN